MEQLNKSQRKFWDKKMNRTRTSSKDEELPISKTRNRSNMNVKRINARDTHVKLTGTINSTGPKGLTRQEEEKRKKNNK